MIDRGIVGFHFTASHLDSVAALKEAQRLQAVEARRQLIAENRRARRGDNAYLFEIVDFPDSALSARDKMQLDDYVQGETLKIRHRWSAMEEAHARGVDVGRASKLFSAAGFLHEHIAAPCTELSPSEMQFDGSMQEW